MAEPVNMWEGKPEPDHNTIMRIARKYLPIPASTKIDIERVHACETCKVYSITTDQLNARLNVMTNDPASQKRSTRLSSTSAWLRQNTSIPASMVASSHVNGDDGLGYLWELRRDNGGRELGPHLWVQMSWSAKQKFAQTLARYHAEVLEAKNRFKKIGVINCRGATNEVQDEGQYYIVDAQIDMTAWHINHLQEDLEGLLATHVEHGCRDSEDPEKCCPGETLARRLLNKIPEFFPSEIRAITDTVLWTPFPTDAHFKVDRHGSIFEIQNIEHENTAPLYACYQFPEVLVGPDAHTAPTVGSGEFRKLLIAYWKTKLRKVYLETMEELHPGFEARMQQYAKSVDFTYAVSLMPVMDDETITDWLDAVDKGEYYSLKAKSTED